MNFPRRNLPVLCSFLFSLVPAAHISATAPYIVAQSDYAGQNGNPGGETIGYPFSQTFTPLQSGTLYTMSAGSYASQSGLPSYYIFQFRDTTPGGLLGSNIIASVNVSTASLLQPANAWIDITGDFSSFGINLTAGHKYALSVDQPGQIGVTTFNNFFWGFTGSGYAGAQPTIFQSAAVNLQSLRRAKTFSSQSLLCRNQPPSPSASCFADGFIADS